MGSEDSGFLSMISDDLKVIYSNSKKSITPEAISTGLDTHVKDEEMEMTDVEKKLLDREPVQLMIDQMDDVEEEQEEVLEEEEDTTIIEHFEAVVEERALLSPGSTS